MSQSRFDGKVALVTGSTSGIGEAIARRLIDEGSRVLLHGLEEDRGRAMVQELGEATHLRTDDLRDPEAPARLAQAALTAFGRIDVLVNNAAVTSRGDLQSTDPELFDAVYAVNLRAPLLLIQACHEQLRAHRGRILNIGSVNAYCGEPRLLAYSATKGGLMTLSRNLADALAPDGIRVTHFNVGWVLSRGEILKQREEGQPDGWQNNQPPAFAPSGRLISPEEIAGAAAYWLSDEPGPISGSVLELEQYPMIGRNPPKS